MMSGPCRTRDVVSNPSLPARWGMFYMKDCREIEPKPFPMSRHTHGSYVLESTLSKLPLNKSYKRPRHRSNHDCSCTDRFRLSTGEILTTLHGIHPTSSASHSNDEPSDRCGATFDSKHIDVSTACGNIDIALLQFHCEFSKGEIECTLFPVVCWVSKISWGDPRGLLFSS
jgi:hypothetical protein